MTSAPEIRSVMLGDDALAFVREEVATAASGFRGPLAAQLDGLELGTPFAYLSPDVVERARRLRSGGLDNARAERYLAAAISRWLGRPDDGRQRVMALEDPLARYGDPAVPGPVMHRDDRVYFTSHAGDGAEAVHSRFKQLAGYPGVGVLSRPRLGTVGSEELNEAGVAELAAEAVAVLVRAWDNEGFLVAPVVGRLEPHDLDGSGEPPP
jgi:hypothetical protein